LTEPGKRAGCLKMKQLYIPDRSKWRQWLTKNHNKEEKGIWLIFYKKGADKPTLNYEDAIEEALCFGWIDSIIKKIDDEKYVRKFTPRNAGSKWSQLNKKRINKMIKQGLMTRAGLAKIQQAKKTGMWEKDGRASISFEMPKEFADVMLKNRKAKEFFEQLAPTYQKQFKGWINAAKTPETRKKRIVESIGLLKQGKKLGLK
jgi:uncharacterized protein YdeI (YjbR/CyaY-like superfamily)